MFTEILKASRNNQASIFAFTFKFKFYLHSELKKETTACVVSYATNCFNSA